MYLRRQLAIGIVTIVAGAVPFAQVSEDPLVTVRRLYEAASYEEALAALAHANAQTDSAEIDEYRALCFLGLNRPRDAEQAIERLVMRRFTSTYDLSNHPPKFVALYRVVQKRALPIAAAALFGSAKTSFEEGHFAVASTQFKELLKLLSDPSEAAALSDLRMLADGFLRLSEQRLAERDLPAKEPQPAGSTPRAPSTRRSKDVYGSEDHDVVPPEIIEQRMPKWIPPTSSFGAQVFQGMLEVVVGENGSVESRIMSEPAFPSYDWDLLQATRQWHYKPAMREGIPVKYRKLIAVTLAP